MSDWGTGPSAGAGNDWGNSNDNSNDNWGATNDDTNNGADNDSFDTSQLKEALPPPPPVVQVVPEALDGWVRPTAYDYTDSREDVPWENNARIYEWDGEEGEIGPEYPELELQLFGDPANREHHGIDFTRFVSTSIFQTF